MRYDIWDGRMQIAFAASYAMALEILSGYDLNRDEAIDFLHRAGGPGDLALEAYGLTVMHAD